jgi:hypothetical protein
VDTKFDFFIKKNMPKDIIVKYIQGTTEADLAMLASCDHVITTIGTFSWWSGWLAGVEKKRAIQLVNALSATKCGY